MKKILQTILQYVGLFGLDPLMAIKAFRGLPAYISDYFELKGQRPSGEESFKVSTLNIRATL